MKGKEVLRWFIRLIVKGMWEYEDDLREKEKLYDVIRKKGNLSDKGEEKDEL